MRSLKPTTDKASVIAPINDIQKFQESVDTLASDIKKMLETIKEDEQKFNSLSEAFTSVQGTFDSISSRLASIVDLTVSDSITTDTIVGDTASFATIASTVINAKDISVETLNALSAVFTGLRTATLEVDEELDAVKLVVDEALVNDVLDAQRLTAKSAYIQNLDIDTITMPNIKAASLVESAEIVTDNADIAVADIDNANITLSEEDKARIRTLYNQTKQFADDLEDPKQYIVVDYLNNNGESGSNYNDDPVYIELPQFTSGWYRVELRNNDLVGDSSQEITAPGRVVADDDPLLMSLTIFNNEHTPLVMYSKDHDGDLDAIYYYDNKLYLKTYATGKLYWCSDARGNYYAPKTYSELPFRLDVAGLLQFKTARRHQIVMLGNHTSEYALTVQGIIEADIIKVPEQDKLIAHYYGNTYSSLIDFASTYLKHREDGGLMTYQRAEVVGYIKHTTDEYRDYDNTETEALEKVELVDETTIKLTIDADYGQDEIIINDEDLEDDNLPFIIGFSIRSLEGDRLIRGNL